MKHKVFASCPKTNFISPTFTRMISQADIYTDGSCSPQTGQGAWVAILLTDTEKITLSGKVPATTHHRMELSAVIEGITYALNNFKDIQSLHIYTDSQYVTGLIARQSKLSHANFLTKKGSPIPHADLVQQLYLLTNQVQLIFTKVKAHQKPGTDINHNISADKLVRKIMREELRRSSL
ncbi:ribonuclease H family protein [Chitinophaga silvisoli]|uniref:ribonuclease H n=1 Tax=Chitinophaga silvisoli TaxID=2291814 RepID=A0A3E1NUK7_9BACT|nr:ribonuclease H [Chitinophaga silvisoli]RFM31632.1 ribonuclease HI [Chitinophaga silvisoli]